MDFDPQLAAGRRFSMIVAVALLLYAYSHNDLPKNLPIDFAGISFPVKRLELDMVFIVLALYSLIRYIHLAWAQSTPPWRIRSMLKNGKLPPQFFTSDPTTEHARLLHLMLQAQRYFPYLDPLNVDLVDGKSNKSKGRTGSASITDDIKIVLPKLSRKTRLWCRIEDVHYTLPLVFLIAGLLFLGFRVYFSGDPAGVVCMVFLLLGCYGVPWSGVSSSSASVIEACATRSWVRNMASRSWRWASRRARKACRRQAAEQNR